MTNDNKSEKEYNKYKCGNCWYFNGEVGDGTQFCEKKEEYVSEHSLCPRWHEEIAY